MWVRYILGKFIVFMVFLDLGSCLWSSILEKKKFICCLDDLLWRRVCFEVRSMGWLFIIAENFTFPVLLGLVLCWKQYFWDFSVPWMGLLISKRYEMAGLLHWFSIWVEMSSFHGGCSLNSLDLDETHSFDGFPEMGSVLGENLEDIFTLSLSPSLSNVFSHGK